jgi:23S rRNA (guanosine2251-2'-O)-methyltransferase
MRKIQNAELGRLSVDDFKHAPKLPFIILLDNVRSMNNIGSVFRTADAFRCTSIGLCGITATPPHREIHKTALGAEDSVEWFYEKEITTAILKLKSEGYAIIAIEQVEEGINLDKFIPDPEKKYVFIFGHEINGVGDDAIKLCDLFIEIPQQGTKHSLNVAVTVGIVCWHFMVKI